MTAGEPEKKSFWSGATGTLTAVTALVTAVGALLAVLIQLGVVGDDDATSTPPAASVTPAAATSAAPRWSVQANDVCARTNDAIDDLPEAESLAPEAALGMMSQALKLNRRMIRNLAALEQPPEDSAEIDAFIRTGANLNETSEELIANLRAGNVIEAQSSSAQLSTLGKQFDEQAIDLGATTCAEGASVAGLPTS